jgi:hypothetical protein
MIRALNFTMMMALLLASLHKVPSPHIFRAAKKSRSQEGGRGPTRQTARNLLFAWGA